MKAVHPLLEAPSLLDGRAVREYTLDHARGLTLRAHSGQTFASTTVHRFSTE